MLVAKTGLGDRESAKPDAATLAHGRPTLSYISLVLTACVGHGAATITIYIFTLHSTLQYFIIATLSLILNAERISMRPFCTHDIS